MKFRTILIGAITMLVALWAGAYCSEALKGTWAAFPAFITAVWIWIIGFSLVVISKEVKP